MRDRWIAAFMLFGIGLMIGFVAGIKASDVLHRPDNWAANYATQVVR